MVADLESFTTEDNIDVHAIYGREIWIHNP